MHELANDLRALVTVAASQLRTLSDEDAATRPAPDEWSPKEIIGHLIDSAGNNHQRFVRSQRDESHDFPGYAQADWVRLQHYQDEDWQQLITTWEAFNLHLGHMLAYYPAEKLANTVRVKGTEVTMEYLITDYVGHMQMHLDDLPVDVAEIKRYPYE